MSDTTPAATTSTLGCGTHLALKGLRHAILGRPHTHLFTYQQAFGGDAIDASRLLVAFSDKLGMNTYRPLQIRQVCCGLITPNEMSALQFLAAMESGRPETQQAHLRWLAKPVAHAALKELGGLLTGLFSAHGLEITPPSRIAAAPKKRGSLALCGGTQPAKARISGKAAYR